MSPPGKRCSVASILMAGPLERDVLLESYDYVRISAFMTMERRLLVTETGEKSWQM